jgi:hypothetical protein
MFGADMPGYAVGLHVRRVILGFLPEKRDFRKLCKLHAINA